MEGTVWRGNPDSYGWPGPVKVAHQANGFIGDRVKKQGKPVVKPIPLISRDGGIRTQHQKSTEVVYQKKYKCLQSKVRSPNPHSSKGNEGLKEVWKTPNRAETFDRKPA